MTTADDLLRQAQERTGLEEIDSDSWRPGLELILRLIDDPRMSEGGVSMVHGRAVDALANRLRVHAYAQDHPEVRDETIERPLFILGMPRTGTTAVSYLLGQDPGRRSLLKWEAVDTVPPATTDTLTTDPRCLKMLEDDKNLLEMLADFDTKLAHWEDADGPTECMFLHEQDFKGLMWDSFTPGSGYAEWMFDECDVTSAYEYQKLVLQILQSTAPGRWSLKMPSHSVHLATLLEVFPDARLIWAHRDPFTATGSLCNLLELPTQMSLNPDAVDHAVLGQNCAWQMGVHVERPMAVRDSIGDEPFFDLHYAEFMRDPMGVMAALYEWDDRPFTAEIEAAMRAWLDENPQHKHGKSSYTLAEYGLSKDALMPVFADYIERFDVELDAVH